MASHVTYNAIQGIPWERLVMVRDRRTHRIIRPLECWARIKTGPISVAPLTTTITTEGGILLQLTGADTQDLPVGVLEFDVMAKTSRKQSLVYGSLTTYPSTYLGETITQVVAQGTITVSALNSITSLEEESQVEIRFKKGEDYRLIYSWTDEDGALVSVNDAYMQAKTSTGATVLDIRWYAATPSEATVIGLTGNRRGYIAPSTGATMELHISDSNTVPAGVYRYDIFVKEADNDWKPLSAGNLVVEESVSTRPA